MYFVKFLKILAYGWLILIVAIIVNTLAGVFGLRTWYGFLSGISSSGIEGAFMSLSWMETLFLFAIYPLILGLTAYIAIKQSAEL